MSDRVVKDENGVEWHYNSDTGNVTVVGCDTDEDGYEGSGPEDIERVLIEQGFLHE